MLLKLVVNLVISVCKRGTPTAWIRLGKRNQTQIQGTVRPDARYLKQPPKLGSDRLESVRFPKEGIRSQSRAPWTEFRTRPCLNGPEPVIRVATVVLY